ncbi:MAG: hypothetical protein GY719_05350 [bacterium]|nr:hypothetical protein [bacterium]
MSKPAQICFGGLLLFTCVAACPKFAYSQGMPVGSEFQINTYTTNIQLAPAVAFDSAGEFVIVWHSLGSGSTDSSGYSIQGQRYSSDGSIVGGEFQVNTFTIDNQRRPRVGSDASGSFVVIWQSSGGSSGTDSNYSIQGQRFLSDGSMAGGEFQVNTYTTNFQSGPALAVHPSGSFVVVWQSNGSSGTDSSAYSIQGQRYASDGSIIGSQFQVNAYTSNTQTDTDVALNSVGDFVVVWRSIGSYGFDSSGYSIQGQRYASNGSPTGAQFQVNSYTSNNQRRARVGFDASGNFVVVWESNGSSGSDTGYSIQSQRYASDGSSIGLEIQVNNYTVNNQAAPSVAVDLNGNFVVAWQSDGSSGPDVAGYSIQSQRFAFDGSFVGSEFQVNTYTTNAQSITKIAVDQSSNFIVVWSSDGSNGNDSDQESIQGQRFGGPVPVELMSFAIE